MICEECYTQSKNIATLHLSWWYPCWTKEGDVLLVRVLINDFEGLSWKVETSIIQTVVVN